MGGFTLIDQYAELSEQNRIVLTLDYFKKHPDIEIPEISVASIEDRSKGMHSRRSSPSYKLHGSSRSVLLAASNK
jgi:hypothetical protein